MDRGSQSIQSETEMLENPQKHQGSLTILVSRLKKIVFAPAFLTESTTKEYTTESTRQTSGTDAREV